MKKLFTLIVITIVVIFWNCAGTGTEKHQNRRNNITDVHERIQVIEMEEVMIGSSSRLQLMDDYLIIQDYKAVDLLIHLFNKNNVDFQS